VKIASIFFLFLFITLQGRAQVTRNETIKLAIQYLNGDSNQNEFRGEAIGTSDAGSQVWSINQKTLCDECKGQVLLTTNNVKIIKIVKEFSTLSEAQNDTFETLQVVRRIYPSISKQVMPQNPNEDPNLMLETAYADGTHGLFVALWSIVKRPDASPEKQFMLTLSLSK